MLLHLINCHFIIIIIITIIIISSPKFVRSQKVIQISAACI